MDERLSTDRDFVLAPRFNNSLKELLKANPGGVEDKAIAEALGVSRDEVEALYQSAVKKLRRSMGVRKGLVS